MIYGYRVSVYSPSQVVSIESHRAAGDRLPGARCALVTVSDSRTKENDDSGKLARDLLAAAGHSISYYGIVPNEPDAIRETLKTCLGAAVDLVLTIGGTGVSARDRTIETARTLFDREMPGFGELFRALSLPEIGSAVILTRAAMGIS
ncbi:MAG: MogA/MoaB family molybdenum cofactor biosynthesis protein, partial [Thermoplasmata archaeon]